jgi:hypothetical protein
MNKTMAVWTNLAVTEFRVELNNSSIKFKGKSIFFTQSETPHTGYIKQHF